MRLKLGCEKNRITRRPPFCGMASYRRRRKRFVVEGRAVDRRLWGGCTRLSYDLSRHGNIHLFFIEIAEARRKLLPHAVSLDREDLKRVKTDKRVPVHCTYTRALRECECTAFVSVVHGWPTGHWKINERTKTPEKSAHHARTFRFNQTRQRLLWRAASARLSSPWRPRQSRRSDTPRRTYRVPGTRRWISVAGKMSSSPVNASLSETTDTVVADH